MKKALSVAAFDSSFGPVVYNAATLEDFDKVCQKVKAYGFDGIDLFFNRKTLAEMECYASVLRQHQLEASMAIFIDLFEQGVRFAHQQEGHRKRSAEIYVQEMDKAQALGALSMPVGFIRGKIEPGESRQAYQDRLAESMVVLTAQAKQRGIKLCLEPINRYEANTLLDVPSAVAFLEKYQLADAWLLPDLFHMNIEDADIGESLKRAGKRIGHMHMPDSNRLAPGWGHMDYDEVMDALRQVGYDGYLSAECLPGSDADATASQAAKYLSGLMPG